MNYWKTTTQRSYRKWTWCQVVTVLVVSTLPATRGFAQAQLSGLPNVETLYQGDLFAPNPAGLALQQLPFQIGLARHGYVSEWRQGDINGADIKNEVDRDYVRAGFYIDAGAGMGIGISHQRDFNKVQTSLADETSSQDRQELEKSDSSKARILIELTDELRAGFQLQFSQVQKTVLGNLFLGRGNQVSYTIPFMGYGFGAVYQAPKYSVGYAYLPPLRGKVNIGGEELIGVLPGNIQLDLTYFGHSSWQIGLLGRKWLYDHDDRDAGSTAEDDTTTISLYGLDIEQYVEPRQQLAMLTAYKVNSNFTFYASMGMQKAEFNFSEKYRYSQLAAGSNRREEQEVSKYAAMVGGSYVMSQYEVSAGAHVRRAGADYESRNGTIKYQQSGHGFEAAIRFKI